MARHIHAASLPRACASCKHHRYYCSYIACTGWISAEIANTKGLALFCVALHTIDSSKGKAESWHDAASHIDSDAVTVCKVSANALTSIADLTVVCMLVRIRAGLGIAIILLSLGLMTDIGNCCWVRADACAGSFLQCRWGPQVSAPGMYLLKLFSC